MKKFMKKLAKKTEGFTLVELIVVIAILGILAGVAIPAYSGYMKEANNVAVLGELEAIEVAAQSAAALDGDTVTDIKVSTAGAISINLTTNTDPSNGADYIKDFYTANATTLKDLIAKNTDFNGKGATWTPANDWKPTT